MTKRRHLLLSGLLAPFVAHAAEDEFEGDPYKSGVWIDMRREYLGGAKVVYDPRVVVQGPAFAEDPMNVPISDSGTSVRWRPARMITMSTDEPTTSAPMG